MTGIPGLLLVEDDRALGAILREFLSDAGYKVIICHDGETALKMLKHEHFDLVLTDINLPGQQDGWFILHEASGNPADTLVILMTGYSGLDDAATSVEKGAYDFISKPIQFPELRVRLDNAVRYQNLLRVWQAREGKAAFVSAPGRIGGAGTATRLYRANSNGN